LVWKRLRLGMNAGCGEGLEYGGRGNVPARSVETETTRAAGDYGDFALEGEDGGEVLQLDLFIGGHFGD
jgi:hypothetical protein